MCFYVSLISLCEHKYCINININIKMNTCSFLNLRCNVVITDAEESRGSKAFIHVCLSVCLSVSVCPHDRTKTAETTITKLAPGIVHHGIRSKHDQGHRHRITKCKT